MFFPQVLVVALIYAVVIRIPASDEDEISRRNNLLVAGAGRGAPRKKRSWIEIWNARPRPHREKVELECDRKERIFKMRMKNLASDLIFYTILLALGLTMAYLLLDWRTFSQNATYLKALSTGVDDVLSDYLIN